MKREIMVKEKVCDFCGSNKTVFDQCLVCKRDICYDCSKKVGEDFKHSISFSGSGDGYFCNSCIANIPEYFQPLFSAYLKIKQLRNESSSWWKDFEIRSKRAEADLEQLLKKEK